MNISKVTIKKSALSAKSAGSHLHLLGGVFFNAYTENQSFAFPQKLNFFPFFPTLSYKMPILYAADTRIEMISAKIDKSNAELKEFVERILKQQLWAMIGLIVPLYLALSGFFLAIYNVLRK